MFRPARCLVYACAWLAALTQAAPTSNTHVSEETLLAVESSSSCSDVERPSFIQQRSQMERKGAEGEHEEARASALEVAKADADSNSTGERPFHERSAKAVEVSSKTPSDAAAPSTLSVAAKQSSAAGSSQVAEAIAKAQVQAQAAAQASLQASQEPGEHPNVDVVVVTVPQFEHTKRSNGGVPSVGEGEEKGEEPMMVGGKSEEGEEVKAEGEMREAGKAEGSEAEGSTRPPRAWLFLFLLAGALCCSCGCWQLYTRWGSKKLAESKNLIVHTQSFTNMAAAAQASIPVRQRSHEALGGTPPVPPIDTRKASQEVAPKPRLRPQERVVSAEHFAIHTGRGQSASKPPLPPVVFGGAFSIRSLKGVPLLSTEASVFDIYRDGRPTLQALIVHQPVINLDPGAWRHATPIVTLRSILDPPGSAEGHNVVIAKCRQGGAVDGRRSMYIFDAREELIGILEKSQQNKIYYLRNEKLQQELSFKGRFIDDVVISDLREGQVAHTQPAEQPRLSTGELVGGTWYNVEMIENIVPGSTMELMLLAGVVSIDYDEAYPAAEPA